MLTVNDLIGLNYSNLKNPQTVDMGPGLSYQVDPAAQGGRRLVGGIPAIEQGANRNFAPSNLRNPITPRQDVNRDQPFLNSSYPQPEFFPNDQQGSLNVDTGATGTIPTAANINTQPLIGETSGIAPLLTADTNMPLDYEEMIQRDDSIITPQRKTSGLETLLQLAISAAIPGAGFLMRGPKGLAGLNRRMQKSDFGQATSLIDYFNTVKNRRFTGQNDPQGGPITTFRNVKQQAQDKIDDRGRGQIPTKTTSAPAPKRQARQTAGKGGLHSGY